MVKKVVTPDNLSGSDFALDAGASKVVLRRNAGAVPVSGVDQLLIRQNGELFQVPVTDVSSKFSFDRLTGRATVTAPDGTVSDQWQCLLLKDDTNKVVGWVWPTPLQADLPIPDINVMNTAGTTLIGKAYSAPIVGFWDVPVSDLSGNVTHYAASGLLPDGNYVEIQNLADSTLYHILAP